MNKSLVSVLVPSYNHEVYVQETIRSIINQTYQNIELIIIDDGSKDSTWQKICEMREVCENRFVKTDFSTKENEGVSATLNKLVSKAQGDYVYLIASDDQVKPTAIEKFVAFLDKNPEYGLVVGNDEIIDSNSKKCYWDKKRNIVYDEKRAVFKTFVDDLKRKNPYFHNEKFGTYETIYPGNYLPNGQLIRKSVLDLIEPYTKEAPLEDYFLMLQLSKYSKFKYIDEVLFSYRWHESNSIKNTQKIEQYTEKTRLYEEEILDRLHNDKLIVDVKKVISNGVLYKRQGFPCLFEIQTFCKSKEKIRVLKLFNIKIKSWSKNRNKV